MCPGVDFHLDHRHSCPSSPCPEARCSALLKRVNVKKKKKKREESEREKKWDTHATERDRKCFHIHARGDAELLRRLGVFELEL